MTVNISSVFLVFDPLLFFGFSCSFFIQSKAVRTFTPKFLQSSLQSLCSLCASMILCRSFDDIFVVLYHDNDFLFLDAILTIRCFNVFFH